MALRQVGRDPPPSLPLFVLVGVLSGTPLSLALAVIWGRRSWWLIGLLVLFGSLWVVARGMRILEKWLERRRQA